METVIDFVLHLDAHLAELAAAYGAWMYGLLFLVVFAETGLVVTPFLPGDSLLFASGALASRGIFDVWLLAFLLLAAAVLGDAVNYAAGHFIGPRVFRAEDTSSFWERMLNRRHLDRTHAFFERYGGKAVVLGRFVPIVRTFVPFVAGAGAMRYASFAFYNVIGGALWVGICVGAGYLFGNIPVVQENFSLVIIGIIAVSVVPMAVEFVKNRRGGPREAGRREDSRPLHPK
jgi:membrane-associated protein